MSRDDRGDTKQDQKTAGLCQSSHQMQHSEHVGRIQHIDARFLFLIHLQNREHHLPTSCIWLPHGQQEKEQKLLEESNTRNGGCLIIHFAGL